MKKYLPIILLLSACSPATLATDVQTQTVNVPVAQPCKPNLPSQPVFSANDEALKNLPFPDAGMRLKKNPADVQAKKDVDSNAYYLLQILAADRLDTRAWIDRLTTALKGCM